MKRIFTLAFTALFTFSFAALSAQSNRMAFVEEATQASCPPCATANPVIQTLMNANSETAIFMGYQVWWPGFDPMYLDNEEEVNVRVGDYYGYGFAPQVVLQGDFVGADGGTNYLNQAELDAVTSQMSEFDLTVSAQVVNGELQVTGDIAATMAAEGDFKLRLMLVEDLITIEDAPGGTNGETEYHHVFKAFIGGPEGIDLEDVWADGDTYTINETFSTPSLNIYHYDGLEVIAIIQNDADKFVHQAAKDHDVEIISEYDNSAGAIAIVDLPVSICAGEMTFSPTFQLANNGNEDLVSAVITYNINGGADQVVNWTGSIATLGTENVVLDPYTFTAGSTNVISATVSMPNGVADEDAIDNDTATAELVSAPEAGITLKVEILTDAYGDETYWQVRGSAGNIVMEGGNPNVGLDNIGLGIFPPPADAASYGNDELVNVDVFLPADDCYTFHITDYYGDGMLGAGYWKLSNADGVVIVPSSNLTDQMVNDFSGLENTVGIEELNINNFNIYPNPTNDVTNITFEVVDSKVYNVEVIDIAGRVVYTENLGQLNAGVQLIQIDAKQFESGMYLFNIVSGNQITSERVSIIK